MTSKKPFRLAGSVALCLATTALPQMAQATSGYFALGFGPVQRGAAGAGVASTTDAMGAALNPASVAELGREFDIGAEIFAPDRGFTATNTGFVDPGEARSDMPVFLVPNLAYNLPLSGGGVLNFAAYGNGGMNTSYPAFVRDNPCPEGLPGTGVYCGGETGVDLMQLFVQVTYANKVGPVSWGIAPTMAVQRFGAEGLYAFGMLVGDGNPDNLTNKGYSFSTGFGLRGGAQVELSPSVSIGVSGQTKFDMSEFDEYSDLFEGGGDFDIPASLTAGVTIKASPALTVMLDYQRIYYSDVPAISNSMSAGPLGADGGAGFGWDDVDVFKLGVEWAASPDMTWRAGYAHASNPVGSDDVMFNILAPGIVEDHFSLGGSKLVAPNQTLDFAIVYVPENTVSGPEVDFFDGPIDGSDIELDMHQFELSVGWRKTF